MTAEDELAEVRAVLDELTMCEAPTLALRVRHLIEHERLVCDARVFDAEKREHSFQAQCRYWMGLALNAATKGEHHADRAEPSCYHRDQ